MSSEKYISWEVKDQIGFLTLNNPPENYIDDPEFISMDLLEEILRDKLVKGIIIKGSGRHFSAGADIGNLKQLAKNETLLFEKMTNGKQLLSIIENFQVPVVASISGACFGGGLEIALAAHIRICSENALFAFPETNYNIIPGLGGTLRLSQLTGEARAIEMLLSGEIINSQWALENKMVDYVVPSKELHEFSWNFLKKMTSDRDIDVINSVMRSIHNSRNMPFEEAMKEETKLFCHLVVKNMKNK
jgi:enoyl-CoA hydratase